MRGLRPQTPVRTVHHGWILAVPLAAAVLGAAACSSGGSSTSAAPPATSAAPPSTTTAPATSPAASSGATSASGGVTIQTAHTSLGTVLTDGKGITVYLFEADTTTKPTCYGACAQAWPPVLTTGAPAAGAGAKASLLGTVKRTDGKLQATYAGHPLYYFVQSTTPGNVSGQGSNAFGAHWDAVRPSGAQAG
jgi:predicted lipoprotein with Yx(FWY)xxD motif